MSALTCGVGYATALPISDVEDWLDENCAGDWDINLTDLSTGGFGVKKKIEILFEKREDLELFKKRFKKFEQEKLAQNEAAPKRGDQRESDTAPKKKGLFGMLRPDKGR